MWFVNGCLGYPNTENDYPCIREEKIDDSNLTKIDDFLIKCGYKLIKVTTPDNFDIKEYYIIKDTNDKIVATAIPDDYIIIRYNDENNAEVGIISNTMIEYINGYFKDNNYKWKMDVEIHGQGYFEE